MSTQTPPEQVAFETPRGNAHVGTVVGRLHRETVDRRCPGTILIVEYEGHRFRVPETDTLPV